MKKNWLVLALTLIVLLNIMFIVGHVHDRHQAVDKARRQVRLELLERFVRSFLTGS